MFSPAPAPAAAYVKTVDECLADFQGCMTATTMAPALASAPAPASFMGLAPAAAPTISMGLAPAAAPTISMGLAPAPAPASFIGLAPAPAPASAQYTTGADNIARLNKLFAASQVQQGRSGVACDDAGKKFSNYWDSKGVIVVPATSGCPTGMALPAGKDAEPIGGLVPCLPTGKKFGDLSGPGGPPSDIQDAMQACSQQAVNTREKILLGGQRGAVRDRLTNSSMSSTYMMEGSPFVLSGYGGPGPNWRLILILLLLVILLWIVAQKI